MLLHRSPQPILAPDQPWEDGASLFAVGLFNDPPGNGLRLYYLTRRGSWHEGNVLCVAHSTDGRTWTKPRLHDGTNIVMRGAGHSMDWGEFMPSSLIHEPAENDPAQRWKLVYWDRPDPTAPPGICLATSADGLIWQPVHARAIITNANDAMSLLAARADPAVPFGPASHYIYQQTWKYNPALPTDRDNLEKMHRRISLWRAETFAGRWVGPITILEPDANDAPDLQFYWLAPYPLAGGGYGGFLNCHHTSNQSMDTQWVCSSDGWTWTRELDRRPLLPLGGRGTFDCGMIAMVAQPVRWQDRALTIYNGRSTVHDQQQRYPDEPTPVPAQGIGLAEYSLELLGH